MIGLRVAQYKQLANTFHFSDICYNFNNLKQTSTTNGR